MARLLPTGFKDTMDMVKTLKTAGLGSLELFCMGLKATGSYLARTLSYHGAKFELQDVQLSMEMRCATAEGLDSFKPRVKRDI